MRSIKPKHGVLIGLLLGSFAELNAQTLEPPAGPAPVESPAPIIEPGKREAPSDQDIVNASSTEDAAKFGPSFRVDLTQSMGAKADTDPLTTLNLTARYKFNPKLSVAAIQRISKLYKVDPKEDDVQLADTSLRASYAIYSEKEGPAGLGLSTALDATLPISQFSQDQKLTTVAGFSLTGTRTLGKVSALLRPFYRHHINQYKTLTKDDSGSTVVLYRLGLLFELSLALPCDLSLSGSNQWTERHYEDPPYGSHSPDHDYSFDLSLTYQLNKATQFAIGYNESNRAEQLGVVDVNLFDVETTSYFVSASREF